MATTLRQFLERDRVRAEIAPHVYGGAKYYGDVVREVCHIGEREPIAQCDPRSIIVAVRKAASWPLTIGARDGSALLVRPDIEISERPQLIAMQTARGKIRMLRQFGGLRWFNAQPVYEHEPLRFFQGENPHIGEHETKPLDKRGRGPLVGAYAIAITSHTDPKTLVVLHRSDIDQIREEYSRDWADGALDDIAWYAVKTAVHKLCEAITLPELARRMLDDGRESRFAEAAGTITAPVADPKGVVDSFSNPGDDALAVIQQAQVA